MYLYANIADCYLKQPMCQIIENPLENVKQMPDLDDDARGIKEWWRKTSRQAGLKR